MTQRELNRAISRVTGESVSEIARRGFQPLTHGGTEGDPVDVPPQVLDWDEVQAIEVPRRYHRRQCCAAAA
jgi:hypothetical protein